MDAIEAILAGVAVREVVENDEEYRTHLRKGEVVKAVRHVLRTQVPSKVFGRRVDRLGHGFDYDEKRRKFTSDAYHGRIRGDAPEKIAHSDKIYIRNLKDVSRTAPTHHATWNNKLDSRHFLTNQPKLQAQKLRAIRKAQ